MLSVGSLQTYLPEYSIDQLPDFRNPGVMARILVIVHLAVFIFAALLAAGPRQYGELLTGLAFTCEPIVVGSLFMCYALNPLLKRMPYPAAVGSIALMVAATAACVVLGTITDPTQSTFFPLIRTMLLAVLTVLLLGEYLRLRNRAFSPALAEARLQSLQARIRPHFLFNSINAVLSLMRADPVRAERVLEDLADLFRTLMADEARLVRLRRELDLVRDYLSIETLRLGERLQVECRVDASAEDALVPPLFLQPLVENAVYHGIEPCRDPGTVILTVRREGRRVLVEVSNPIIAAGAARPGNHMAVSNIRERLSLHFDADATLRSRIAAGRYEISIDMPYRERE